MGSKHQSLVKSILLALGSRPDLRLWESQTGLVRSMDGRRTFRHGLTGCADITGIASPGGIFVGIEAKVGDDVQRESQARFQAVIERFGGVYVVAYSPEEAEEVLLERLRKKREHNARHDGLENHSPIGT
jgi:hypothetical protein